jgi:hypothetical protein
MDKSNLTELNLFINCTVLIRRKSWREGNYNVISINNPPIIPFKPRMHNCAVVGARISKQKRMKTG